MSCIGSAAPSGRVFAPFSSENGYNEIKLFALLSISNYIITKFLPKGQV